MKTVISKIPTNKLGIIIATLLFCVSYSYGQPSLPTRSIEVTATQSLQFGAFVLTGGAGGSVSVGWDGSRTAIGNIALLPSAPTAQPAIFETKLLQGRKVHVTFSPTATLSGSNGGSLTLNIGPTEYESIGDVFPTSNDRKFITILRVGGKLDIPGATIPGVYTGTFFITFNQE